MVRFLVIESAAVSDTLHVVPLGNSVVSGWIVSPAVAFEISVLSVPVPVFAVLVI